MRIDRDGFKYIAALLITGLVFLLIFRPAAIFFFLLAIGVALFFRESKREAAFKNGQIACPASGRLIDIREVFEPEFLKTKALRLSIFMSLLDEHINYAPLSATVVYLQHRPGGFKRAYLEEASDFNEAQKIGWRNSCTSLLMKQIAGVVARRVVCRCRLGDKLRAGEKLGLIRFGSRVELYLPLSVRLHVNRGQRVKGGVTSIGEIA